MFPLAVKSILIYIIILSVSITKDKSKSSVAQIFSSFRNSRLKKSRNVGFYYLTLKMTIKRTQIIKYGTFEFAYDSERIEFESK